MNLFFFSGRSIELPTGTFEMSSGFFLAAEVIILGYSAKVEIELKIPDRFYLKGEFAPLYLAGGAICMTRVGGTEDEGPLLEIELEPKERKVSFIAILDEYLSEYLHIFIGSSVA